MERSGPEREEGRGDDLKIAGIFDDKPALKGASGFNFRKTIPPECASRNAIIVRRVRAEGGQFGMRCQIELRSFSTSAVLTR